MFAALVAQIAQKFALPSAAAEAVVRSVLGFIETAPNGIGGIAARLKEAGFTAAVEDWAKPDAPVLTPAQAGAYAGGPRLAALAQGLHLPADAVAGAFGFALPKAIGLLADHGALPATLPPPAKAFLKGPQLPAGLPADHLVSFRIGDWALRGAILATVLGLLWWLTPRTELGKQMAPQLAAAPAKPTAPDAAAGAAGHGGGHGPAASGGHGPAAAPAAASPAPAGGGHGPAAATAPQPAPATGGGHAPAASAPAAPANAAAAPATASGHGPAVATASPPAPTPAPATAAGSDHGPAAATATPPSAAPATPTPAASGQGAAATPAPTAATPAPAAANAAPGAVAPASPATRLSLREIAGTLFYGGVVPDTATAEAIKTALTGVFGADAVKGSVAVDPRASAPSWLSRLGALVALLKGQGANATLDGDGLTLKALAPGLDRTAFEAAAGPLLNGGKIVFPDAGAPRLSAEAARTALDGLGSGYAGGDVARTLNLVSISFDTGSVEIPAAERAVLVRAASLIKALPAGARVAIEGYTDNVGEPDSNLALSQRRADAVKVILVEAGLAAADIEATGYGEANPVADNATPEGRARNRRITYEVHPR